MWSAWEQWAPCPVTCGFGVTSRDRKCNNPAPSLLGQQCDGHDRDWRSCRRRNCPIENCLDIRDTMTGASSGVYTISTPVTRTSIQVYCDMDTAGGGWTVFQRRFNGSLDFNKSFLAYENGFGFVDGELWLGLITVNELTTVGTHELRIDIMDVNGTKAFEVYSDFQVGQGSHYTLHLGARTLYNANKDMDNSSSFCAQAYFGGWWYNNCATKNLNGPYISSIFDYSYQYPWRTTLRETRMMFRQVLV
ncbi:FCN2-like protein [Mya arenaria]|uniref:FCN2-like protein n=1 Tax=Mya arenaria TaxID=6604 RepID=A0ABY7G960_MYAAR|nr:FCN2-like protein [Mya arenaria]